MKPDIAASLLMDLDDEPARQLYAKQKYITIDQLTQIAWERKPTTFETRAIHNVLLKAGWTKHKRRNKVVYVSPTNHPIRMAVDIQSTDWNKDAVRLAVGRSDVPPEHHAELIAQIINERRQWDITQAHIAYKIAKFKKQIAPPQESEDDKYRREDIKTWLEEPETQQLIASRPHRYVTGAEIIEGAWLEEVTPSKLKEAARLMWWPKTQIRIGSSTINGYIQPKDDATQPDSLPNLDKLDTYLTGRYAVMEYDVLRDVAGIAARQIRPSDRIHLAQVMRTMRWKRERSRHEFRKGWCYTRLEALT